MKVPTILVCDTPHDADPHPWAKNLVNWLYDWSATPMTYCSACALRTMYEGEYFATIDRDSIDIGVTLRMIKDARRAVYNALIALENNKIPTPAGIEPLSTRSGQRHQEGGTGNGCI
jgi:hypothetical protein